LAEGKTDTSENLKEFLQLCYKSSSVAASMQKHNKGG
jgi:hypothetical protein